MGPRPGAPSGSVPARALGFCELLLLKPRPVDRRLAYKNLRTGLIAGAIAMIVFALSWVVGLVY